MTIILGITLVMLAAYHLYAVTIYTNRIEVRDHHISALENIVEELEKGKK